jgi:mRNA interferase HigB
VYVVTEKHLNEAMTKYRDAANEIKLWKAIVKEARWHHFEEVRSVFKDADPVDGYVIFDFRDNRYRLVTVIHWAKTTTKKKTQGHVHIRSFLTHKEYDNPKKWTRTGGQNERSTNSRKPCKDDR